MTDTGKVAVKYGTVYYMYVFAYVYMCKHVCICTRICIV